MAAVDRLHRRRAHPRASSSDALAAAGLADVEIRETHRVHDHAASAIIRARKPGVSRELQLNDPQTLYRRWEDSQWSPFAIDLSADREQWAAMDGDERDLVTSCCPR